MTKAEKQARDPERTKSKLLATAAKEFAKYGFDGARVDTIAKKSGVNKAMIYHYFENKKGLFAAMMRARLARKVEQMQVGPQDPVEGLSHHFRLDAQDPEWTRLQQWESLRKGTAATLTETMFQEVTAGVIEQVGQAQDEGQLPAQVAPDLMLLALSALTQYPLSFPQITRRITGSTPTDPDFQRRWSDFLDLVATELKASAQGARKKEER